MTFKQRYDQLLTSLLVFVPLPVPHSALLAGPGYLMNVSSQNRLLFFLGQVLSCSLDDSPDACQRYLLIVPYARNPMRR